MTHPEHKGYFHCQQCDSIFEEQIEPASARTCPACGHSVAGELISGKTIARGVDVSSGLSSDSFQHFQKGVGELHREAAVGSADETGNHEAAKIRRSVPVWQHQEQKRLRLLVSLIALLIAVCAALLVYTNKDLFIAGEPQIPFPIEDPVDEQTEAQKRLISDAMPACIQVMQSFLETGNAATKSRLVYQGPALMEVLEQYYKAHPRSSRGKTDLRVIHAEVLDIAHLVAISTICQDERGERFEAVFIKDGDDWKIDWKSFVRYSPADWALFDSGENGDEEVFRLYMRLLEVGEDIAGDDLLIVFYKPDIFRGEKFKAKASESIRIAADSALGMQIKAMIGDRAARSGRDSFGANLSDFDPAQMQRVRVSMGLRKEGSGRCRIELLAILADHWYGEELASQHIKNDTLERGE